VLISDEEMRRRSEARPVVIPTGDRGYHKLFLQSVTQADTGVDFDFLQATTLNGAVPRT
jgi:dihydroxy-acid dehydratase